MPCASPTNAAPLRNGRRRVPPAPRALPRRRLRFRRLHLRLRTRARRAAAGPRRSPAGHLRGLRRRLGRLRGERPRIQRGRLRAAHPSDAAPSSWEKPRGPLPLSLFGAGDDQEEEGPGGPLPTDTAPQRALSFTTDGSRPADLKDLIAGLYGSQPSPTAGAADAGPQEEAEDGEGLGDDDWEFTAATAEPADQDRGGRALGDGIGKIEGITKSLSTDQEVQSSLTSVDEKLNHFRQTTVDIGTHESTGECVKASGYSPPNNSAILNLYKESVRADVIRIEESSAESVQNLYDLFSNNEMMKTVLVAQTRAIFTTNKFAKHKFRTRPVLKPIMDNYTRSATRLQQIGVSSYNIKGINHSQISPEPKKLGITKKSVNNESEITSRPI